MIRQDQQQDFEQTVLTHLDAAYNYAFWLTRDRHNAEDLTQESCSRALAAFARFEKNNARAWLLTIVRHTFLNQVQRDKQRAEVIYLDTLAAEQHDQMIPGHHESPETQLLRQHDTAMIRAGIARLPTEFREIIVLREIEELSYEEIATVLECPQGTVMSRLSRARNRLRDILQQQHTHLESSS